MRAPETLFLFTGRYLVPDNQNFMVFSWWKSTSVEFAKPWTSNASEQSCRVESVTTGVHKAKWPATLTLIFLSCTAHSTSSPNGPMALPPKDEGWGVIPNSYGHGANVAKIVVNSGPKKFSPKKWCPKSKSTSSRWAGFNFFFWSPDREFKAYVGASVRLRLPRFCLRHNNFKQLAYASLTANQAWGYAMILLHLLQTCTALKVHASPG